MDYSQDDVEDESHVEYQNSDYDDTEEEEQEGLKLHSEMVFETWQIAEAHLNDYARQEGFCFRKRRRIPDPIDNNITRRQTFECSHARIHDAEKAVLAEKRRDRDSEM